MEEKSCKRCKHSKDVGYRQVVCGKTNRWESELYSCPYFAPKEDSRKTQTM